MKSKDDLKEIDIFDDITRFSDRDTDFNAILFDEKISFKTSTSVKPLHIRFDKINGFIENS